MYTQLAIKTALIPEDRKSLITNWDKGLFSNDGTDGAEGTERLVCGYNENREIVYSDQTLNELINIIGSELFNELLSTAIEYTQEEFKLLQKDPNSIWYKETETEN